MTRNQKQLSFTVIADSNCLFPKDPTQLVSPKFADTWKECLTLADLKLVVPDIVKGERLYQVRVVIEKALENATRNLATLFKIPGRTAPELPTRAELLSQAETRFDQWLTENKGSIATVPCETVDWKRVVNDSIWRNPPFEHAGDHKDSEKGFRDCMILETVRALVSSNPRQNFVLISNDQLLMDAATSSLQSPLFRIYESIDIFISDLRVSHQKNRQMIEAIVARARSVFFSEGDANCVFLQFKIAEQIIGNFPELSLVVFEGEPSQVAAISGERIFIHSTLFRSRYKNEYEFGTRLTFARLFAKMGVAEGSPGFSWLTNEVVRIAKFDVFWSANVTPDAIFKDCKLSREIDLVDHTSEIAVFAKGLYGFPPMNLVADVNTVTVEEGSPLTLGHIIAQATPKSN